MQFTKLLLSVIASISCASAMALDARDRGFISRGMHEGEVLFKIGKPDHEAFIVNLKGQPEQKTWTYFPHPRDSEVLTIITFRSGVVAEIERKIAR